MSADPSQIGNSIALSIPTNLLGGAGGAGMLNFNYDFGPTVSQQADQANTFLSNANAQQTAFLGQTISQTQGFLSNVTQPLVATVTKNTTTFGGLIPFIVNSMTNLFTSTSATQSQIANAGFAATQAVSQASIASSNSSAGQGGCFITTAVCGSLGLADDNVILRTLRAFRDDFMLSHVEGRRLVSIYYRDAPDMVAAIDARHDSKRVYWRMLRFYLLPAVKACRAGDNDTALRLYAGLVDYARVKSYVA